MTNHLILTQKEIAVFFEIDVRTVKRWIKKYRKECLNRKARDTKSYKIKQKHVNYLLKILKFQVPVILYTAVHGTINMVIVARLYDFVST